MRYKLIGNNYTFAPIETIFENRNIKDYKEFIKVSEEDELNYFDLDNIELGVETLLNHLECGSKIQIVVDVDCDGNTSAAILYNYIKEIYPNANIVYSLHEGKQHGLSDDVVIDEMANLIILPDASSNDYEQHKYYKDKGIDIIVLDHHEASSISENAIVINNQLSPNYTNKSLSGVGVVYKFLKCIDDTLYINNADYYLDLVAIGNVGDAMDLHSKETRYYVKKGLEEINNKFIQAMIDLNSFQLDNKYNIKSLGWVIAPKINGVIRSGTQLEKKRMFEALIGMDTDYEGIAKMCNNVKARQDNAVKSEMKKVELKLAHKSHKYILLDINGKVNSSFSGLVANKLKSKYKAPTLLYKDYGDGFIGGSARGHEEVFKNLKDVLIDSNLMEFAEGHANAFGWKMKKENLDKLNLYLTDKTKDIVVLEGETYEVDLIFEEEEIEHDLIEEIASFEDEWGNGLEEPLFLFKNVYVSEPQLLGSRIKNVVFTVNGVKFIKKFAKMEMYNELEQGLYVDIIGRCSMNLYNGKSTPQIEIVDINNL